MKKLFIRLSALTLALIVAFLILKDKSATEPSPHGSTSPATTVTEQDAAQVPQHVEELSPDMHDHAHEGHDHAHAHNDAEIIPNPEGNSGNQLNKALNAALQGAKSKEVSTASFAKLRGTAIGEAIQLDIAGVQVNGTIAVAQSKGTIQQFAIKLDGDIGNMLIDLNPKDELEAQILLNGESNAFTLYTTDSQDQTAKFEQKSINEIYCAPKNATYSQTLGLQAINAPVYTPADPAPEDGEIPILSSKPDSEYVLYLDLDGEIVSDAHWTSYNFYEPINAAPMPSATNASWVTAVFRRISEDYVPFDINVTTDAAAFREADVNKRVQCVFTTTNFVGDGVAGIANVGSFGKDRVCWVFWEEEYYGAWAASHEVGHTLGLSHDGNSVREYYGGQGDGETSWAPIMGGVPISVSDPFEFPNVLQWSIGDYDDANNQEDDLELITTSIPRSEESAEKHGLNYREDDYGDQEITAETLSIEGDTVSHYGIISETSDEDWFKFITDGGAIQIDADVIDIMSTEGQTASATYGADLAVELTLYDASGAQIDQTSSTETLGTSLTTTLGSGLALYYVSVDGAGRKDPLSDGFSDYGSLGEYLLSGTIPIASATLFGGDDQDELVGPGATAIPSNGTSFGFVSESTTSQFTFTNTGTGVITTTAITSDMPEFTVSNFTPATLNPGESQTFNVTFDTLVLRFYTATVTIDYDDGTAQTYPFAVNGTRSNVGGDDNYEYNNTFFDPYDLSASPGTYIQYLLGFGIQKDNDWFRVVIPAGSNQITAQCDFVNSEGDIDLSLYDQDGRLLSTSSTGDDSETVSHLLSHLNGSTFYLLVKSAAGSTLPTLNYYDLIWNYETVAIVPPNLEDAYEENDLYTEARDISDHPSLSGYLGLGTQLDNDWFKFVVPEDDNLLNITCTFTNDDGNIDIAVYDDRGYQIIASNGTDDGEQILIPISYPGDYYYVAVTSGGTSASGNTYDLEWETSYVDILDDFYEENDSFSTAVYALDEPDVRLSDNTILGAGIQFDDDWFEFRPASNTVVMLIRAEFPDAEGDIFLSAYDEGGNLLSTGVTTDVDTFVNIEVHDETRFYLRVSGDNIGDPYDLYYENLTEDKYAPNHSEAAATDLTEYNGVPLSQILGSGIQRNNDWYRYDVPLGSGLLYVVMDFLHDEGDLDMELYRPDGTSIVAAGVDDRELIEVYPEIGETTILEGSYYLRVYGWRGNHNNAYDMAFYAFEPPALPDPEEEDNYEPNNLYTSPSTVLSDASQRGVLLSTIDGFGTQLNADWYQISVPAGENLVTVQCDFTHYAEGNIDMNLYTSGGLKVSSATTSSDNETITYVAAPSGGTYLVQILGANAGIVYDLSWTSIAPPPEDNYEPNNSINNATNINSQKDSWLSLLNGPGVQYDPDWYSFTTTGKNTVDIICQFTNADQHNLRLVLYRNGYKVAEVDSDDDNEVISYEDTNGGNATYKLLVDGSDNGTSYDIYWNATPIDTTNPVDDNYEDNDSYFEAYDLTDDKGVWLSSIDGNGVKIDNDLDWYRIDIPANVDGIAIQIEHINATYQIYLRDKDGRYMGYWESQIYEETDNIITGIFDEVAGAETYYLQIEADSNGTEYDINWDTYVNEIDADSDNLSDAWESAHGLSISEVNTDENPDSDRYPNWAEYTLNLDPNVFSSNVVRQFQDNNYTYIQFIQRKDAIENGYSVTVKESATLSFSEDEAVHVSTVTSPDDAETDIVTYRCSSMLTEAPACFFMLEINKPE